MPRPLVANRRERILDAAEQLVLATGFDSVSVAAIAARAGIGKGAVYLEFANKRDVLDALLLRGTERLQSRVDSELGEGEDRAARMLCRIRIDRNDAQQKVSPGLAMLREPRAKAPPKA